MEMDGEWPDDLNDSALMIPALMILCCFWTEGLLVPQEQELNYVFAAQFPSYCKTAALFLTFLSPLSFLPSR